MWRFFLLAVLFSCKEKHPVKNDWVNSAHVKTTTYPDFEYENHLPAGDTSNIKNLYRHAQPFEVAIEETQLPLPIRLNLNPTISVKKTFDAFDALCKLFPGNIINYRSENDSIKLIGWVSPSTKKITYSRHGSDASLFPDDNWNSTFLCGDYQWKHNHKNYRLISFFHTDQKQAIFCGRDVGAEMGVAIFEENAQGYRLKAFNPLIGCYGNYDSPVETEIFNKEGAPSILRFADWDGFGGMGYTETWEIAMLQNNKINTVLFEPFLSVTQTMLREWNSTLEILPSQKNQTYPDLVIYTHGYHLWPSANEVEENSYLYIGAPDEFLHQVSSAKDPFSFEMQRVYTFNKRKYVLKETMLNVFPLEVKEKTVIIQ